MIQGCRQDLREISIWEYENVYGEWELIYILKI